MKEFIKGIVSTGLEEGQNSFDQRRIRLVNSFCLIAAFLIVIFSILNLTIGATKQAMLIFSGIFILALPPMLLNKAGKSEAARFYFIAIGLLFADLATFRAVLNFQNRHNEIFLVGYSTIIVVLLDNPAKLIFLSFTVISTLVMITLRQTIAGLPITGDTYMAYLNAMVAYGCIYFFINIYKNEQLNSVANIKKYNEELEAQRIQIIRQRDEIFANRQMLRSAVDALPLFISLIDMNRKYLMVNSKYEQEFGKKISEIEGKDYREVLPENLLKTQGSMVEKALEGEAQEFDQTSQLADGTPFNAYGKYVPIYGRDNKQFGIAIYVVDVTKLKQVEAKLRTLNQSKNRLLSVISHDIRGPLNSLKGLMSIRKSIKENELSKFNDELSEHLKNVSFNVDNLLNWAKTQMEGFKSNPTPVNVNTLVKDSVSLFNENIKLKSLDVKLDLRVQKEILIDRESINLVVRNVISNAIKFSPKGTVLKVVTCSEKNNTIIEVIDQGKGIEAEKLNELVSGSKSLLSQPGTDGEMGTGLGLSLCLDLLKVNNGDMEFINNEVGTTVRIILDAPNSF